MIVWEYEKGRITLDTQQVTIYMESGHEHGTLRYIMRRQHPFAPIDSSIKVVQSTICGQKWSFGEAGDSHDSYMYSVRRFPSECALTKNLAS
ncbi:MAG: hypothetical protein CL916_06000 [Deltaproteobacteria bacterium]|nr:hypothetical protein [Deltaproteobacteria bacterium]